MGKRSRLLENMRRNPRDWRIAQIETLCRSLGITCEKPQPMKAEDYAVEIRPLSAEDGGGFVATVPQLPGCMSDGDTPEHALANAYDAIACWLEAAVAMGRAVPAPRIDA